MRSYNSSGTILEHSVRSHSFGSRSSQCKVMKLARAAEIVAKKSFDTSPGSENSIAQLTRSKQQFGVLALSLLLCPFPGAYAAGLMALSSD